MYLYPHAGPPDPAKTTFEGQNEMFIVQKNELHTIIITPRDRFGNLVPLNMTGISVTVKEVRKCLPPCRLHLSPASVSIST